MATNVKLKQAIDQAHFSYETLARKIQEAGYRYGQPNACNKATVARWLGGAQPHPHYVLLLEAVLNTPAADLGIASDTFEMDREQMLTEAGLDTLMPEPDETSGVVYGELTGVWLSEYEYESSSRKQTYNSKHYVLLLQRGKGITIRSLPKQASALSLDLTVNGRMCTGVWTEITQQDGFYHGAVYSGGIQLEVNQTSDRLSGMWIGFGKNPGEFNNGKWSFSRVDAKYDKTTREKYDIKSD